MVSSLTREMTEVPNHLQMGTFIVVEAGHDYVSQCARQYQMLPDASGGYMALYRPTHMIGLEPVIFRNQCGISRRSTGAPGGFHADVVAVAKRDLKAGEMLDGEGGYTVWGKQLPVAKAQEIGGLPLGLAANVRLKRDIAEGASVGWDDVDYDAEDEAVRLRREMEAAFGRQNKDAAA